MLTKNRGAHCSQLYKFVYKLMVVFSNFCSNLWGSSGGALRIKVILGKPTIFRTAKGLVLLGSSQLCFPFLSMLSHMDGNC